MKKILYLSFVPLILFFSCPQYIAVGTVWKGTIDGLGKKSTDISQLPLFFNDQATIELYFNPDNTLKIFLTVVTANYYVFSADGDYYITPSYAMGSTAGGQNVIGSIYVKMNGQVNTTTGSGSGDYTLEFQDGTYQGDVYNGSWKIGQVRKQ